MGQYVAQHVISFVLFLFAFILLLIGSLMSTWYTGSNGYSFSLVNSYSGGSYQFQYQSQQSSGQDSFSSAINGCAFTSVALAAVCVVLSFIMMCAECCCHVNKYLAVIPRVTIGIATFAGILAEAACILLLVKISNSLKSQLSSFTLAFKPGASFYIVAAAGLVLMIVGCVNCRVRYGTRVEALGTGVVVAEASQMQSQTMQTSFAYPTMPHGTMMPNWGTSGPAPQYLTPYATKASMNYASY